MTRDLALNCFNKFFWGEDVSCYFLILHAKSLHTIHRVLKARMRKWFVIPFSSGPHFVRTLHQDPLPSWVGLHGLAHIFIDLDKAVIHVISLVSFRDCGFHSVCPLMDEDKRLVEAS